MLCVSGIVKSLGGRMVLREVDLEIQAGKLCVLRGENGSGKTTLLKIIVGALPPDRGSVEIDGRSVLGRHHQQRRRLGYVPERGDAPSFLTPRELIQLAAQLRDVPFAQYDELAALLGLARFADTRIAQLSLGERRRACLAAALIGPPALVVLDEPTNGLDADSTQTLLTALQRYRDGGTTVLVASHDDRVFALADRHCHLVAGTINATRESLS